MKKNGQFFSLQKRKEIQTHHINDIDLTTYGQEKY